MADRQLVPLVVSINKNAFSGTLQRETRDGIEALCAHFFIFKDQCYLKKLLHGSQKIFGYISLEHATQRYYLVQTTLGEPLALYATVTDMVNDGWVVD